jgi:CBS domain containing-hemolysin-like protein
LISSDENDLLGEIMELSLLKVRHVMAPRVDMLAVDINMSLGEVRSLMNEKSLTKIPVYNGEIDKIVGMVGLRDLILEPEKKLSDQIVKAEFVPEQKNIESLLESFRTTSTDTAIVVDEYGGIAGMISLEDCVEEIVGPIDPADQIDPIEQIGPLEYRLAGNLAIHDWAEVFGVEITSSRATTIAGLTAGLLGKVPKPGDAAYLKNLKLTVENVHKHRIQSLILTFQQLQDKGDEKE